MVQRVAVNLWPDFLATRTTPASVRSGPPLPGTHTRAVLAELGYDDRAINAMLEAGLVKTAPGGENWLTA